MRKKSARIIPKLFLPILPLLIFAKFTKCQQTANDGNNRVKIIAECGNEQMTLHVQFNEHSLPNGRFTDWIMVGSTTRPECRLQGNGELRYIVQIGVLKDPCATKLIAPGIFQNTLRIANFPGLILSDDLNFEFKCAHGTAEILELKLPQSKRTESEHNEQQQNVPMRPPSSVITSSTQSNSRGRVSPPLFSGDGLGSDLVPSSSSIVQQPQTEQRTHKSKFMVNSEVGEERLGTGNAWTEQKGGAAKETAGGEAQEKQQNGGNSRIEIGTGDKRHRQQQGQQEERSDAKLMGNSNNDNFDPLTNQWDQRRGSSSSFPSNLVVVLCGFLALFLIACVFLAMLHTVKQFRAARMAAAAPFAHLDSRTSPGNLSLSPAESDGTRERVGVEWRTNVGTANRRDTTTGAANEARDQLQLGTMAGSYHMEEMNLEPPTVNVPTVPFHSSTKTIFEKSQSAGIFAGKGAELRQQTTKAFGNEHTEEVPKSRKCQRQGQIDNEQEHERGEFNAAACRSITEIYRRAEMKLKNMMTEATAEDKATRGHAAGEYSTLKKIDPLKERENLLLSCVNKIRGYGIRKLTEQEMLRWRQLIRNDTQFQSHVFESNSEEQLLRICELPQYRMLFTKMKWTQIMGCIAEELLEKNEPENGGRQRNSSTDTVRRMKPLPALPAPSKFCPNLLSQPHQPFNNYPNGSLKIYVGNGHNGQGGR